MPIVSGGLDDQPFRRLRRMTVALNTYNALKGYAESELTMAEYIKQNPQLWQIRELVEKVIKDGSTK